MKNKRLILTLTLAVMMTLTGVLFVAGQEGTKTLSIRTIKETVTEDNLELQLLKDKIDLEKERLARAEEDADKSYNNYMDKLIISKYDYFVAGMNYDNAKIDYYDKLEALQMEVTENYYNYILLTEEKDLTQKGIDRLYAQKENLQKEIDLGLKKSSELVTFDKSIKTKELQLNQLQLDSRKIEMDLNILMNNEVSDQINMLTASIPSRNFKVENISEDITKAIENSSDIDKAEREMESLEIKKDILKDYLRSTEDSIKQMHDDLKEQLVNLNIDLKQKKADIEYSIRSQYNTVLNDEADIEIANLKLDNLQIQKVEIEKKYEHGLVTKDVLDDILEQIENQELAVKKAKLKYYLAVVTYDELVD